MLVLEHTQERSAAISAVAALKGSAAEGQELPHSQDKTAFPELFESLKEQIGSISGWTEKQSEKSLNAESPEAFQGVANALSATEEGDPVDSVSMAIRRLLDKGDEVAESFERGMQDAVSPVSTASLTVDSLTGEAESSAERTPELMSAEADAPSDAESFGQLPQGWLRSLQQSGNQPSQVVHALSNRLQKAYPALADLPKERINADLGTDIFSNMSEEEIVAQLQKNIDSLTVEAGIETEIVIGFKASADTLKTDSDVSLGTSLNEQNAETNKPLIDVSSNIQQKNRLSDEKVDSNTVRPTANKDNGRAEPQQDLAELNLGPIDEQADETSDAVLNGDAPVNLASLDSSDSNEQSEADLSEQLHPEAVITGMDENSSSAVKTGVQASVDAATDSADGLTSEHKRADDIDDVVVQSMQSAQNAVETSHSAQSTMSASAAGVTQTAAASSAAGGSTSASAQTANWSTQVSAGGEQGASGSQGGAAGGQTSQQQGQQSSQFGQNLSAQMSQQRMDQDVGARQQAQTRAADEALQRASVLMDGGNSAEGLSGERRATLPPSMQTIPLPVKHPQWGQAFGQRVSYMLNAQVQQAQITLNPEKLGPIQIKLHFDRDQQVQLSVVAQNGATREAIDASIPRLREMMEQAGVNLASVDVNSGDSFADQQADQEELTQSSGNFKQSAGGVVSENDEPLAEVLSSDSLVDFYA
ncbi:flagellar hook-length control protein FliK [Thiomicrorhabdus sp. 6S3-12]|uniref:flagellar hook-length control protein FliK n=1 Tax=Thiomicrorhabdus sp. 6S3-12 TaxID=2819681 RepID=UPI001AAC97B2|nr:flagellar hook-length control protein FliK [Thiomicrorhabdus sp. 6S3-12]MBO1924533.1 flagellar hook-length control protein FliK [Thiomicrorhabdus sp. 6S3-12]